MAILNFRYCASWTKLWSANPPPGPKLTWITLDAWNPSPRFNIEIVAHCKKNLKLNSKLNDESNSILKQGVGGKSKLILDQVGRVEVTKIRDQFNVTTGGRERNSYLVLHNEYSNLWKTIFFEFLEIWNLEISNFWISEFLNFWNREFQNSWNTELKKFWKFKILEFLNLDF